MYVSAKGSFSFSVAPEAIRVVDSTKKLIAKTLILLTAKQKKKDEVAEEQAEFQRRIVNFRTDFKAFLDWKEKPSNGVLMASS